MRAVKYLTAIIASFLLAACQQAPKEEAHQENNYRFEGLTVSDEVDILTNYSANTLLSIELADIAVQNANSEKVRAMATTIAKDHRQMFEELKELAANFNMALPARLSEEQMETVNMLKSESGASFDKTYVNTVIAYHEAFSDKMENIMKETSYEGMMDFARAVDAHQYVHMNEAKQLKMSLDA